MWNNLEMCVKRSNSCNIFYSKATNCSIQVETKFDLYNGSVLWESEYYNVMYFTQLFDY